MAGLNRKLLQGTLNIIRFNIHTYIFALLILSITFLGIYYSHGFLKVIFQLVFSGTILTLLLSLSISAYIYDFSDFYSLKWLDKLDIGNQGIALNIHSGYDETSSILKAKYPNLEWKVMDFYNPTQHTERSIELARKAYPNSSDTIQIATNAIPVQTGEVSNVFLIFGAHEIRDDDERIGFFKELNRVLNLNGSVFVVEHLRNFNNFLAYNIGFMHFFSNSTWLTTFKEANLEVVSDQKINQFVHLYQLKKDAATS